MHTNGTVQKEELLSVPSVGQISDIGSTLASNVIKDLCLAEAKIIISNKKEFNKFVREAELRFLINHWLEKQIRSWSSFYLRYFNYSLKKPSIDYHTLLKATADLYHYPLDVSSSFRRALYSLQLIIVGKIPFTQIVKRCEELLRLKIFYGIVEMNRRNYEERLTWNARDTNIEYSILTKDSVEALDPLDSNRDFDEKRTVRGITLTEQLLYTLKYFADGETYDQHLDLEYMTVCTGSRFDSYCVPAVYWADKKNLVIEFKKYSMDIHGKNRKIFM